MITASEFLKWLEVFNVTYGTHDITFPITMAQGGTGASLVPSDGSIIISNASTMELLPTAFSGVLVTDPSGIPSISSTLPAGLDIPDYLPLIGGTLTGALTLPGSPTLDLQAATKQYVDSVAGGLTPAGPVDAATTVNFDATYDNGSSGVGATLTANSTGVVILDGITTVINGFYLFKNQTDGTQNGIYQCSTAGAVGVAAIFTRATTYDTPTQINSTGIVPVVNGSTQAGQGYYQTNTIVTIGTTVLNYIVFGNSGTVTSITAGTGLSGGTITTAGTISLTIPVVVSSGGTGLTTTTANGVICGGTTSTGAFQNTGAGTAGQLFISEGSALPPAWLSALNNAILKTDNSGVASWLTTANSSIFATNSGGVPGWISTVTVPNGGTGLSTTTAFGVICAGTTATGNFQNTGAGTAGQLFMSNGASALPSWLASANNAVLVTNGSGIPSLSTTLPSGLTLPGYLPLSGGTMTGALNMGTFGISNMADPSLAQDAVTLTYLQSNYVNLAGSTMTGLLVLSGAPTADLDAATKLYVDQTAAGLAPAGPVEAASTTNFAATYNNGSSGIGATLTATSTGVVTLDGITTVLGGDYLFKNQTTGFQNGIYVCTTAGAVGVAGVFTRSNRYDTPSDINNTGIVPVINGSTQAGQGYYQTSTVVSVGVTPITYINFGSSGTVTSITAGTGLSGGTISTAGTISLTIPVVVSSGGTGLTSTTAYGVMCGGTTTTANLQNTGAGTAGQLFMSNGAAALPSWLATANNSVLVTDGSGTPSLATTLPSGLTIPSPLINTGLYDINGNQILRFTPTASAVDNFEIINNIGGANALGFGAVGTNTDIIVSLYGKGTGRAQIKGTGVNDNVSTGFVGEEMQSVILSSGALVTLANGTAKTMVSLTLTAGDWDIWGNVFFNLSGNGTFVECGISTTTNTLPDTAFIALVQATLPSSQGINAPGYRVSIASTTTYYLIARCGFSTGAATCNGGLYARRRS